MFLAAGHPPAAIAAGSLNRRANFRSSQNSGFRIKPNLSSNSILTPEFLILKLPQEVILHTGENLAFGEPDCGLDFFEPTDGRYEYRPNPGFQRSDNLRYLLRRWSRCSASAASILSSYSWKFPSNHFTLPSPSKMRRLVHILSRK